MTRMKRFLLLTVAVIVLSVFSALPVTAQTVDSSDFTVQAILPKNQIDKEQSYFDLLVKPGETQTLHVDVMNTGEERITIDIALRAASTNRNGVIEYQVDVTPDDTLRVPFHRIARADPSITVMPKQTKRVGIQVTMPDEKFEGTILGGIVFTRRDTGAVSSGVSIANQFAYVVGVKLSETKKEIDPSFQLGSIEPTLINYRNAVVANIQNTAPLIIKNADVTAHVYQRNRTDPLFSVSKSRVDMAPNSTFPLPVEWEGTQMDAGNYTMEVKMTHNRKSYEWTQDFTINQNRADQINQAALNRTTARPNWLADNWWVIVLAAAALLLLVWLIFTIGRRERPSMPDDAIK